MELTKPYLLYLGDSTSLAECKTAAGLRDWCPADVIGQYALVECSVDLGLPRFTPESGANAGARSLVIGVAPVGGAIPTRWTPALLRALEAGLDIVSGMHTRLGSLPDVAAASQRLGRKLFDVRHTDQVFTAATGVRRSGRRLLTVGTDCALGKKYTALALTKALRERGLTATFRATGQTGIMIAGSGVAIDAVVADFIAGAAEWLSPSAAADHWDVIEGQGALFHPAYGGVTLGLVHGSQPDALVLCHDPLRTHIEDYPHHPLPTLQSAMEQYVCAARITNRDSRFVGISLNTSRLDDSRRRRMMADLESEFGLPVIDPILDGASRIAAALERDFAPATR
jgi:uncharacterized NAD-dependent epimerase/dehydratase family protein